MASQTVSGETFDAASEDGVSPFARLEQVLRPLASLKLTVVLFVWSIILVMAGTLAQVELDIWDVVRDYFRCWFAWMPIRVWYPLFARIEFFEPLKDALKQSPPGLGIWFPGGYLLGTLMAVNLLAAHLLRFKVQAHGHRLAAGIVVTAIGCVATWLVIASGHDSGLQQVTDVFYDRLWTVLKVLLGFLLAFNIGGAASAVRRGRAESPLLVLSALTLAGIAYWVLFEMETRFSSSSMRILWQLVKAEAASLVLLGGCWLLFRKRAGVTLLHAGVALVMVNEVVVDSLHVETQMAIEEGQTVSFARDIREIELAVVDRSSPDYDEEIVIRRDAVLAATRHAAGGKNGMVISDPQLPFDIEILEYMQNSEVHNAGPGSENRATAGIGLQVTVTPAKPVSGTDSSGRMDLPAAYVRILDRQTGDDLGTYLIGLVFELQKNGVSPNRVTVDGRDWEITLRFRRYYKPYSVRLVDVSKTDYIGTSTPMDYRSIVDVLDAESGEVLIENRHIWMNNPMRYAGDTFYQSGYSPPNPRTGEKEITTLSVVSNTGWMLPYMSCMIVGTGMLAHFFGILLRFLNRRSRGKASLPLSSRSGSAVADELFVAEAPSAETSGGSDTDETVAASGAGGPSPVLFRALPVVLTLLAGGWLLSKARIPSVKDGHADLYAFGKLPIVYQGRVKPIDTLARNTLRALSNREEFRTTPWILLYSDRFDEDSNGQVGLSEMLGQLDQVFSDMDQNSDGRLSGTEVRTSEGAISSRSGFVRESFESFDTDHDRNLSRKELTRGVEVLFEKIDTSSDRELDAEELLAYRWSKPGEKKPAIAWLLDVISDAEQVRDHAVFRIDSPQIVRKLKLERRKQHLYSINEIARNVSELAPDANRARQKPTEDRTQYDTQVLALEQKIGEYDLLASSFAPPQIRQDNVQQVLRMLQSLSQRSPPLAIPPTPTESDTDTDEMATVEWETVAHASVRSVVARMMGREENQQLRLYADILDAHLNDDAAAFNAAVKTYQRWLDDNAQWLESHLPPTQSLRRTGFEAFYNHFAPFYYSAWSYLFAFVLTAAGLLGWSKPLNRSAFLIILVTLAVHSFALGARVYISGRPPVTNLYSSAVFIGWGCVVAGLVFERLYDLGIGNLVASVLGAGSLGISHLLSGDGDTFAVLQAVLDTQFWLATHVVLITLGYSATFLAGHLGIVQVLGSSLTPWMTKSRQKDLARMIYGTVCFGMFFSFVGTVLGGLWADDSWGRFWGWDPKENGALLIVIWNALLLHVRWDRLVSDRGFAILAIAGNVVTSWSWFGVNELGIGLHSYGFTDGVWLALWCYWFIQAALVVLGVLAWREGQFEADSA